MNHPAKVAAFAVGVIYLLVGVVGFAVTGFTGWVFNTPEDLLSFDLNGFHNVVHLGVGAILIGAAVQPEPVITQGILIGGGTVYLVAAVLGFMGELQQLLSIDGTLGASDNYLHLASGLAAVLVGLLGGRLTRPRIDIP